MPEGDTLRKLADFMAPRLSGQTLVQVSIAGVSQPELARRKVIAITAQGKHLLVRLSPESQGWQLRVHLGMYGSWHSYRDGQAWQRPKQAASVVLTTEARVHYVCFYAADVACVQSTDIGRDETLRRLGPNLLLERAPSKADADADADADITAPTNSALENTPQERRLEEVCKSALRRSPDMLLIDLLLNQSVAAGFGNVYKSELMFVFGYAPSCVLKSLQPDQVRALYALGMQWLAANLGGWPRTTTVDRRYQTLPPGQPRLHVYARAGEPCLRCKTPIVRALLGRHLRSTYSCPTCQMDGPARAAPSVLRRLISPATFSGLAGAPRGRVKQGS